MEKNCCCPMTGNPKMIVGLTFRVSLGLSLIIVGLAHYMGMDMFSGMVTSGLGPLEPAGKLWAYVLPALQIVGGVLLVSGQQPALAAWALGIGLGSIPVGMLSKSLLSGAALPDVMGAAQNALLWLVFVAIAVCMCCCGSCSKDGKDKK